MKARREDDKVFFTAENEEERELLHHFAVIGGIRRIGINRCQEPDSELELTLFQDPFVIRESSPVEVVGTPEALQELEAALRRCTGLILRFLR